jgi:hypothetical protein
MSVFGRNYDNEIADLKADLKRLTSVVGEQMREQAMLVKHLKLTRITTPGTPATAEYVPEDDPRALEKFRSTDAQLRSMYAPHQNMAAPWNRGQP